MREGDIIQEKRAAFTYENALYIRMLLEQMEETIPKKILLVCQAFHGARAGMYFQSVFPDAKILNMSGRDTGNQPGKLVSTGTRYPYRLWGSRTDWHPVPGYDTGTGTDGKKMQKKLPQK